MHEKQGFFNLENKLQDRLRYFMALLAILQILASLITLQTTSLISLIIGIALNLFILYFSFSIRRAPNIYFQLITWVFWIVIIFNGWKSIGFYLARRLSLSKACPLSLLLF